MNIYEIEVRAMCPHNKKLVDVYAVTLTTDSVLMAERISSFFKQFEHRQLLQEDLTKQAAVEFGCRVQTVGIHAGVKVTSVAP